MAIKRKVSVKAIMKPAGFLRWRNHMGFHQARAATALGISVSTVQKYESGAQIVPLKIRLACLALVTLGATDYAGPVDV